MKEIRVRSLGWEDPLEKGMATHSSILAWRIPRIEEPGGLQSTELQKVRQDRVLSWNELPFLSPGDLPDPGVAAASPALAGGFFTTEPPGTLKSFKEAIKVK